MQNSKDMKTKDIPLLDCPVDFLIGDASGKIMNEYGRFPCKIQCGVYALMVRGAAKATINITHYEFRQNDVLMLEPGSFLLIHEFSEDALVYYVLFSSSFLDKNSFYSRMSLEAMQLRSPILQLSDERADLVQAMYTTLSKAMNCRPSALTEEKMVHVFNILQIAYAEIGHEQENVHVDTIDRATMLYQNFSKLVLAHYREWHRVSQYAVALHITLPHMCATVKRISGKKASDIIDEAILTDAKAQLKLSDLQVKEIAMSLGFDNEAFFYRYFKAHLGMTPKQYRNSI